MLKHIYCTQFVAALCLLVLACGGGETDPSPVCESMTPSDEVESCVVEGVPDGVGVRNSEDMQALCTSTCDTLPEFRGGLNVRSLRPLKNIRYIQGPFTLQDTKLTSLDGVQNIREVGSEWSVTFEINRTPLTSTAGFDSLETIRANEIKITTNRKLERLEGFPEVTTVIGPLGIFNNDKIRSIDAFPKLERVEGALVIEGNDNLPRCEAERFAESIDTITGDIIIRNNGSGRCE